MIVDSSALIAILRDEPEAEEFALVIAESRCAMSAVTWVEAGMVEDSARDPIASRLYDELIRLAAIKVIEVTTSQAERARAAYRDFGRGSGHAARLNFGDRLSYALASEREESLLFKGDDFGHTDLVSARKPSS